MDNLDPCLGGHRDGHHVGHAAHSGISHRHLAGILFGVDDELLEILPGCVLVDGDRDCFDADPGDGLEGVIVKGNLFSGRQGIDGARIPDQGMAVGFGPVHLVVGDSAAGAQDVADHHRLSQIAGDDLREFPGLDIGCRACGKGVDQLHLLYGPGVGRRDGTRFPHKQHRHEEQCYQGQAASENSAICLHLSFSLHRVQSVIGDCPIPLPMLL